jgi:hypothetical protein
MKFGVVCDVEGKTYLQNGTTIDHESLRYIYYITNEGRVRDAKVTRYAAFSAKVSQYCSKSPLRWRVRRSSPDSGSGVQIAIVTTLNSLPPIRR